MAEALSRTAEEDKPPMWAQTYSRHPTARREAPAQGLIQQLASAARAGREILPGVASGLWDIVRIGETDSASALPFHAPPTPFNVEISGSRRFASQSYSLARLKRMGEAAGATVNDVSLAICAGALRKYLEVQKALPRKPLIAMVPVSLHGETDAGGNQVSLLLANLATNLRDPLKRLQRIVQSTTQAKERLKSMPRLQKMAHGIASISPMGVGMVTGTSKQRPPFNVVISNVPGPKHTLYLNGARLDEVYPVSIPTHYLALNITISGYGDNLGFGYIACRRSVPTLQRMLDYTDEAILELEQALAGKLAPVKSATAKAPARKRTPVTKARK
jgi:diacylglycerol O-acyltransferase